jgi:hypothetical protein
MITATIRRLVSVAIVAGALVAPATGAQAQAPTPTAQVPPGLGVKLLQGPADAVDDPRAHQYIVDHLTPGTTISRQVGFSNGDAAPVDLTFYADAATIHDGGFEPGAAHSTNDLTSWTTFSPSSATVQPGQTVPVTVTIAVPADATAGERYGAALAEHAFAPAGGGGVSAVSRVGIRIYLSVGPGGAPITAFTIDSMTAQRDADGNPLVSAQVHNTGERAIDLSGHLDLSNGPSPLAAGPFTVRTVATLKPGESGPVTVPLDRALPDGPWDAKVTLTSGITSATGTARLTFPKDIGSSASPVAIAPKGGGPSLERGVLFALCALPFAGLLLLVLRRRRTTHARASLRRLDVLLSGPQ